MRIAIHTQYYPPEIGAPQARLSALANYFAGKGHGVFILTAMPNYPQGRIYRGYGGLASREQNGEISIIRSWIYPTKSSGLVRRLVSYLSFVVSSFVIGWVALPKLDYLVTETPPLFLGICGMTLAKMKDARWVLNVSDLWPDSAKPIGLLSERSIAYRILQRLAHLLYRKAWLVTGQSREIVGEIKRQVPSSSVYHLPNGVDSTVFSPGKSSKDLRKRYLADGEVGFVYAGLHGLFQGLEQILLAAERLRGERIRFLFFGDGPEKDMLVEKAERSGLRNVDFYPPISHKEMPAVLASMDVALIPLKASIRGAVPSKIYEAMASSLPILLMANGEARKIVCEAKAGIAIDPGDIVGLALTARALAWHPERRKEMGKAGRLAAETLFERSRIAGRFESVLLRGNGERA